MRYKCIRKAYIYQTKPKQMFSGKINATVEQCAWLCKLFKYYVKSIKYERDLLKSLQRGSSFDTRVDTQYSLILHNELQ